MAARPGEQGDEEPNVSCRRRFGKGRKSDRRSNPGGVSSEVNSSSPDDNQVNECQDENTNTQVDKRVSELEDSGYSEGKRPRTLEAVAERSLDTIDHCSNLMEASGDSGVDLESTATSASLQESSLWSNRQLPARSDLVLRDSKGRPVRENDPSLMQIKAVLVGDAACGKTSLISVFVHDDFPLEHVPTVFENYLAEVDVVKRDVQSKVSNAVSNVKRLVFKSSRIQKQKVDLQLWDTAGQDDFDRIRQYSYVGAHVFIVCFAIDCPTSLRNVEQKWFYEVRHYCPKVPMILVGNKMDLRSNRWAIRRLSKEGQTPIRFEEGSSVAAKIGAVYMETSAKTKEGVGVLFQKAVQLGARGNRRVCSVM